MEGQNTNENKGEETIQNTGKGIEVFFERRGFTNVEGNEDLVEEFHKFYVAERKSGRVDVMQIFREFRTDLKLQRQIWFNPQQSLIKGWLVKWENSLPIHTPKVKITKKRADRHLRNERDAIRKIEYHELEDGAKNLQSLLLEDAESLMTESQEKFQFGSGYWKKDDWEKIRLKKKALALSIAKEILSGVQKHQVIQIKKNKEGRETVGFMVELFKSATAGELSEKELDLLDTSIPNA